MSFAPSRTSRLLNALALEETDHTPVWFMRQAGRSLPEYRALRQRYSFLEICQDPALTATVTLQPVKKLGVDAAILFADIMTPLIGIGMDIDLVESVGPVVANPITTEAEIARMRPIEPESDVPALLTAISLVRRELDSADGVPLIGFAGAPFTLASYLVEGRATRDFRRTKLMMYSQPELWHRLMQKLADLTIRYLLAQVVAGVQVVQLFDSWAGALSASDYIAFVQPYSRKLFAAIGDTNVPTINFSTGTAGYIDAVADAGGTAIGIDWRTRLGTAWQHFPNRAIQGNLDPMVLLGPADAIQANALRIIDEAGGRPGHVFNLGHGVHPETPVDNLRRLVAIIHEYKADLESGK